MCRKKIMAVILVASMLFGMSTPAFAQETVEKFSQESTTEGVKTEESTTEEGTTEEGTTEEGTTEEGKTEEGTTEEGKTEEDTTEEGKTEEGTTEEGKTEEGTTEEGTTEEGTAEEDTTEDIIIEEIPEEVIDKDVNMENTKVVAGKEIKVDYDNYTLTFKSVQSGNDIYATLISYEKKVGGGEQVYINDTLLCEFRCY